MKRKEGRNKQSYDKKERKKEKQAKKTWKQKTKILKK